MDWSAWKDGKGILDTAAIPVLTINDPSSELSPEFGGTMTIPVPQSGSLTGVPFNGVQLLQRRPSRYKAVITVQSLVTSFAPVNPIVLGASPATAFNNNPVGVNVTIAGGTVSAIAVNGTSTGATSGTFFVPAGGTITVTYTVAPTVTTAYPPGVTVAATAATGIFFSSDPSTFSNPNNPQGTLITVAPYSFQWENQEPLYAIAVGSGPVNVAIIDQAAAARVAKLPEHEQMIDDYDALEGGYEYDNQSSANRY